MSPDQIYQYAAFFLGIGQLITGFYVLLLNAWHTAHRHTSALLLVVAVNTFAISMLSGVHSGAGARNPVILLTMTAPAIQPLVLMASLAILKPGWLTGKRRWIWSPVYFIAAVPAVIIALDAWLGTSYMLVLPADNLTGLSISNTQSLGEFTGISLYNLIFLLNFSGPGLITLLLSFYCGFLERKAARVQRRLGIMIFFAVLAVIVLQIALENRASLALSTLSAGTILALVYAFVTFRQATSEMRLQRGGLGTRLTAMILAVVVPILIGLSLFIANQAGTALESQANQTLINTGEDLAADASTWIEHNLRALNQLVEQPDIISMDAQRQKPVLQAMDRAYPEMYLVSTTDLTGLNVARSDSAELTDYSDRSWFQQAAAGDPVAYQTLIGRTSGQPALVVATPIYARDGSILGVGMFATDLDALSAQVNVDRVGASGVSYILDDDNRVIAHPDPQLTASLQDFSGEPVLGELDTAGEDLFTFQDQNGVLWRAYTRQLENGWKTIVQIPLNDLLTPVRTFRRLTWVSLFTGSLLLAGFSWLIIRQSLKPVHMLTQVAENIAAGDLSQPVQVQSDDEFGLLARTFNRMTAQIRDLIANLERRVAERTRDLERRAVQLQVTAEVAREAASIRDLERLLSNVVYLISERFNFYHAGIFLIDEAHTYAVLQAASSEGGQRMLARRHMLKIGEEGIVGHVAATAEPRIALDVGKDAVYFDNPDMPQTRSEMALPMTARDQVIGVLDVQSTKASAFSDEDVAILQVLSDQIALAIDNARLLQESRMTLEELRNQYSMSVSKAWQKNLAYRTHGFQYDLMGARPMEANVEAPESADELDNPFALNMPIQLRAERIGRLRLKRDPERGAWTEEEREIVSTALEQLAQALENARLMEQNRRQVQHEQLIGEIAASASASLNLETVMRMAVQEIGEALGAERVQIQIDPNLDAPGSNGR